MQTTNPLAPRNKIFLHSKATQTSRDIPYAYICVCTDPLHLHKPHICQQFSEFAAPFKNWRGALKFIPQAYNMPSFAETLRSVYTGENMLHNPVYRRSVCV